jgi:hypothetical protein
MSIVVVTFLLHRTEGDSDEGTAQLQSRRKGIISWM